MKWQHISWMTWYIGRRSRENKSRAGLKRCCVVLCKTFSVLLCVQPIVDNSSSGSNWEQPDPIGLRMTLHMITGFWPRDIVVSVSCPDLDFQRHMSWSIFVFDGLELRCGSSFCWFWRNCLPSLFRLVYHHCLDLFTITV